MQLPVIIPLFVVFLCVVDSRRMEFQRHQLSDYRKVGKPHRPTTPENMSPKPTPEYPDEKLNEPEDREYSEVEGGKYPELEDDKFFQLEDEEDWPYAMMELTSLFGRCITTSHMVKNMRLKRPKDGYLSRACPHIFRLAKMYTESGETIRETIEEFVEENFGLLQCANLLAVKDNIAPMMKYHPGKFMPSESTPLKRLKYGRKLNKGILVDEDMDPGVEKPEVEGIKDMVKVFLSEADDLFAMCEKVYADTFESIVEFETKLEKDLKPEMQPELEPEMKPEERYFQQVIRKALKEH